MYHYYDSTILYLYLLVNAKNLEWQRIRIVSIEIVVELCLSCSGRPFYTVFNIQY